VISVLVVDDHPVIRKGLTQLISSTQDLRVVGSTGTGESAVVLAGLFRPDVVLMDIELPTMTGIDATRAIVQADAAIAVVIVSTFDDPDRVEAAVDAGASGFLSKSVTPEALIACIRLAPYDWVSYLPRGQHRPVPILSVPLTLALPIVQRAADRLARRD
jgi:DNA-binding NarL/FixJ family response regulator